MIGILLGAGGTVQYIPSLMRRELACDASIIKIRLGDISIWMTSETIHTMNMKIKEQKVCGLAMQELWKEKSNKHDAFWNQYGAMWWGKLYLSQNNGLLMSRFIRILLFEQVLRTTQ